MGLGRCRAKLCYHHHHHQLLMLNLLFVLTLLAMSLDMGSARIYRRSHKHLGVCRKEFLKPLEKRETDANLVFTGVVERVYKSQNHPHHYRGLVRVKRVIKGRKQFQGNRVIVEGFGSQKICVSDVKEKDTRIFLTTSGHHGRLKLNSSLIRVNRKNLRKAVTASNKARRWAGTQQAKQRRQEPTRPRHRPPNYF